MKVFKYLLVFLIISTTSYAGKLDDYIKISQNTKTTVNGNSLNKALNLNIQDEVLKKLDTEIQKLQENITTRLDKELQKTTSRIDNMINKSEKLVDNATNEYNDILETKKKLFSSVGDIMSNLPKYIFIAKLVFGVVILGLVSIIFFLWRSLSKMKKLSGSFLGFGNLEAIGDVIKKINELDKKIDKLMSTIK